MATNPRQTSLFDGIHPKQANIIIKDKHELVQLSDMAPWPEMIEIAMNLRASKVKALVGPEPYIIEPNRQILFGSYNRKGCRLVF